MRNYRNKKVGPGVLGVKLLLVAGLAGVGMVAVASSAGASSIDPLTGNAVSVAPQVSTDPTIANLDPAWGGFINTAGTAGTSTANVGDTVQVLVTSIQTSPDPYAGSGSFSVAYDPTQFAFVSDSANAIGSCDTSTPGVVTCAETGLENATAPNGKSDAFYFKVLSGSPTPMSVTATVTIDTSSTTPITASATFNLSVAPVASSGAQCKNGGWQVLVKPSTFASFMNQGQCVSYFAKSGATPIGS